MTGDLEKSRIWRQMVPFLIPWSRSWSFDGVCFFSFVLLCTDLDLSLCSSEIFGITV